MDVEAIQVWVDQALPRFDCDCNGTLTYDEFCPLYNMLVQSHLLEEQGRQQTEADGEGAGGGDGQGGEQFAHLLDAAKLDGKYKALLVDYGAETLGDCSELTEDDLSTLGLKKLEIRRFKKILAELL
jgi:hypothetical protein